MYEEGNNKKYDRCTRNKRGNIKLQTNVGSKWDERTYENRIRSQQIRESWSVQPINEWMERRREWYEHLTIIYVEVLFKISRYNVPPEEDFQDFRKEDGASKFLVKRAELHMMTEGEN